MKISKIGTTLAGLYLLATACCVAFALATNDSMGRFVILQLPFALQAALLPPAAMDALRALSWTGAYALLVVPTTVALYVLGALVSALVSRSPDEPR